jgi:siderophore synthetase component
MNEQYRSNEVTNHLNTKNWLIVNRKQLKKAIAELAHEELIQPKLKKEGEASYLLYADDTNIYYEFDAKILTLDHWCIDESSMMKISYGKEVTLDLLSFVLEFEEQLKISKEVGPTYLEELTSTLFSQAYKYDAQKFNAEELVHCDFQQIEQAMIEGHPCFVANSGRIGFNGIDYRAFAPETAKPFRIIWLAGHKSNTCFSSVKSITYKQLLQQELGASKIINFKNKITSLGKNPDDFIFIPIHPWQWFNKVVLVFAADIADKRLIYLGESTDEYTAQQSIRTLYNKDNPNKFYTKTALSIINMGFMRGLSPNYMKSTPVITDWINNLLDADLYLQECGFLMLGEVATVGYTNQYYEKLDPSCAHNKMLSSLWRESPTCKKKPNQSVLTMAALLHVDYNGIAFLPELIKIADCSIEVWLKAYFKCYFSTLLHCFFKYELVFMPHGENVILILENNIPTGIFMKDITEEILLYNKELTLPKEVQRVQVETTDEMKILSLFTDVFDCYFRFMSAILHEKTTFSETSFWKLVANCVSDYQERYPAYAEKYERYDLFVPEFKKCCLNRLQLNNNKQMLDLANPIDSLQFSGRLKNPIASYKKEPELTIA